MATPLPSNFTTHLGLLEVHDMEYIMRVLKMKDSVFIFIVNNEVSSQNFDELAMALPTESSEICSTTIMGAAVGCGSEELAKQLARKLKKQVYLSFNVPYDRIIHPSIARKMFAEIVHHPDCF